MLCAIALFGACTGSSHGAASTSSSTTASTSLTPTTARVCHETATVHGAMYMAGGLGLADSHILVNGTVIATDTEHRGVSAAVRSGRFAFALCGGTYTFVGRTPQWNSGTPCPTTGPVALAALPIDRPPYAVTIVCPMR